MSYSTSNPPALATQRVGSSGGAIFIYKDGDSLDDVCDINYVSNAGDLGIKAGDKVVHIDTTDLVTTDLVAVAHRTSGTAAGALANAIEPIGETSIALQSAGTGTVLVGDIVYFDNDLDSEYEITTGDADISGGATLVITPGLVTATAVGTKMYIKSGVINLAVGKQGSRVVASAPSRDILASESGSTFTFDTAAGQSFTLPVGVVGMKYRFVTTVDLTSNAYAVLANTDTAGDFFVGAVVGAIEGAATDETHFANGSTHLGISMNKTTTGGLIGGWLEIECIAANLWYIKGIQSCTATPATPFTT
jgi:hypothetical protein